MPRLDLIQHLRATFATWATKGSYVLQPGEIAVESDTLKLKVGNGTDGWSTLPYVAPRITIGTASPTGGSDGDVYLQYTP